MSKIINIGSRKTYTIGFVLSLCLTMIAWLLVNHHVQTQHLFWTDKALVITIMGLAISQLIVQLIFFLHLFSESKPRWNLMVFGFMAMVLVILVGGSLWIMYNLNYHHHSAMSPQQTDKNITHDEGIKP